MTTFSQDQMNSAIANARREAEGKAAIEIDALKARLSERDTTIAENAKRETELTAERDRARSDLDRAKTAHATEVGTLKSQHETAITEHKTTQARTALHRAMVDSGMLVPQATQLALQELDRLAVAELDEQTGALSAVTFNGKRYDKPAQAVESFFSAYPYFAKGSTGGGGGARPSGFGRSDGQQDNLSATQLIERGLAKAPGE